ncbi:putative RNA polymerase II transcription factor B of subunit 1 [Triangularia verruculosa]|uniref:RNA polymerase II transcription factor B of subunit 1 n=1 Tax=Triangularia verruculosa TaxID=2587418 RepID=A0AAN7B284_9PEZI|nr:putative RNA polymerase II transcription factor B of subunit 1 [Triangularia verruculosa]
MELPQGRTIYKKKDGVLTLTDDKKFLIWSPFPATGPPTVSLALDRILNLQQTPDTAAKVILKVIEKPKGAEEGQGQAFLFQFTSPTDARAEANAIKALLSQILSELRGNDPSVPKPIGTPQADANGGAGASAAMSFASTVNSKGPTVRWFDDSALKADLELQRSLLNKDEDLAQTYAQALSLKPPSISDAAFDAQFWSTRIGLLRSHAIEANQKKGAYNVLSTIKPRTEDGEIKLSLNPEQIQTILHQHPLVRRIYNENVPKVPVATFWSKFFLSKLCKKLRGERVTDVDNTEPLFDKYLDADNTMGFTSKINSAQQLPHIIDIEANEENQGGFKSGNRKDVEMRPRTNVPIVRTLNSISEKIMADVAPSDLDPSAGPTGIPDDTRTIQELTLRDLRGEAPASTIKLNLKEQSALFSTNTTTQNAQPNSTNATDQALFAQQDPSGVLFEVQADLEMLDEDPSGGLDLRKGIGVDDESDDEANADPTVPHVTAKPHAGSHSARLAAKNQILSSLKKRQAENTSLSSAGITTSTGTTLPAEPMTIPADVAQQCYLTNASTVEFLRQFYTTFMSADANQAEVRYYVDALGKSRERIEALAEEAERLKKEKEQRLYQEAHDRFKKTGVKGKRPKVRGGREDVLGLFEATLLGLRVAEGQWEERRRGVV